MYQTQRDIGTLLAKADEIGTRMQCVEDKMEEAANRFNHAAGWIKGASVIGGLTIAGLIWLFSNQIDEVRDAITGVSKAQEQQAQEQQKQ